MSTYIDWIKCIGGRVGVSPVPHLHDLHMGSENSFDWQGVTSGWNNGSTLVKINVDIGLVRFCSWEGETTGKGVLVAFDRHALPIVIEFVINSIMRE